jgi:tight adherence protein B
VTASQSTWLFILAVAATLFVADGVVALTRGSLARRRQRTRLRLYAAAADAIESDGAGSLLRGISAPGWRDRWPGLWGRLALELRRAAVTLSPSRFVGLSLALGWIGFQGLWLWAPAPLWALPGVALSALPWIWLRRRSRARALAFEAQFPEALDLLIRALRAGHSLTSGIQLVADELPDPLGGEFAQLANEVRLGQPMKRALDDLVLRVENADVAFFATAVAVQQETGSNLIEVLENLARVIRDRFQLLGKVRALTALGRASANLLGVWPLIMVGMLWMVNVDYVAPLWESPDGRTMVLTSAGLVVVGYGLCRRMATIRV